MNAIYRPLVRTTVALSWLLVGSAAAITPSPAIATAARERLVDTATRDRHPTRIAIVPGRGVTLDFSATGQQLVKVWLDDPLQIVRDRQQLEADSALAERLDRAIALIERLETLGRSR